MRTITQQYLQSQIDQVNSLFARVEHVRKFTVLDRALSVEDGEVGAGRLAHDLEVGLGVEEVGEAPADDLVIVEQIDADRPAHRCSPVTGGASRSYSRQRVARANDQFPAGERIGPGTMRCRAR